jgi:hypothetical protein
VYRQSGPIVGTATSCSLTGLVATLTQCLPVRAGSRYYVTDIVVQTTTATSGDWAIRVGTGTNCGTGTAQLFPVSGSGSDRYKAPIAANPPGVISLSTPLAAPAGAAVCVIGTGTNTINITLLGYWGP